MTSSNVTPLAQEIIDISPNIIYIRDSSGVFHFANQALSDLLGVPRDNIIGKTIADLGFTQHEHTNRWQKELSVFTSGERLLIPEERAVEYPSQDVRWFRSVKIPLEPGSGHARQVLTISTDLTERKRAEDVVRGILEGTASTTAEDFFHSLVHQLAHALEVRFAFIAQVVEPDRSHARTLAVYCDGKPAPNEDYLLAGSATESILTEGLKFFRDDVQQHFPNDTHLKREGIVAYMGAPILGSNGAVYGILSVMDNKPMADWAPGRWLLRIFASRAAAEIERLEAQQKHDALQKQLLQAQKMEAIGQLAAGIAHDLNNALGAVVGHLELLHIATRLEPESKHSVEVALKGCERASSLIEQLLGFSRRGKYHPQILSLRKIVEDTLSFLGRVIDKRIKIVVEGAADISVEMDHAQLEQVLTNLILNAAQAMPLGGTITVTIGDAEITDAHLLNPHATSGNYATLAVSDTGTGIKADHLDKIFEPFFTTKPPGAGSGLGLSMVYGIMQHHGGWIRADSQSGEGATFTLYAPRAFEQRTPRVAITLERVGRDQPHARVLLIDDEQMLVELGCRFFERAGFTVHGFTSARKGIDWYVHHATEVDLAIIDMRMPEVDGVQCFNYLRAARADLPVFVLSGYSADEETQMLINKGNVTFFQKPVKYGELVKAAQNIFTSLEGKESHGTGR
jgi:PAS domain S-box-containing protein